jgi:hypothetical protein
MDHRSSSRGAAAMKYRIAFFGLFALTGALIGLNKSALSGETTPAQTTPNMDTLVRTGSAACSRIAVKAKDMDVFGYCIAELLRPHAQGRSCIAFATASPDSGFHCDAKGLIYYKPPMPIPSLHMTKEEMGVAFSKVLSRHSRRSIANCFLANENDDGLAACLRRDRDRLKEVFTACSNTKFNVENDKQLLQAVDLCIQDRLKS